MLTCFSKQAQHISIQQETFYEVVLLIKNTYMYD